MTTGESEGDSSCESGDFTLTSHMAKDLPQSVVTTPVVERPANLTLGSEPTKVSLSYLLNPILNSSAVLVINFSIQKFSNKVSKKFAASL
jgi:hypothetical protein